MVFQMKVGRLAGQPYDQDAGAPEFIGMWDIAAFGDGGEGDTAIGG